MQSYTIGAIHTRSAMYIHVPLSSKRNLSPDSENVMGVVSLVTGSVL